MGFLGESSPSAMNSETQNVFFIKLSRTMEEERVTGISGDPLLLDSAIHHVADDYSPLTMMGR
jgi:hypothetical protein